MFAVFGKSLKHEQSRKGLLFTSAEERFVKNAGAYQISPDYSTLKMARAFVELAAKSDAVRCTHIARLEVMLDKGGEPKRNKKTNQEKTKYKRFIKINKEKEQ